MFSTIKPKVAMIGAKGIPAKSGGIERHVEELSVRMARRDFDVVVYAREWYVGRARKQVRGVRIATLPSIHLKHFDTITHVFVSLLHAIFVERPDIIHIHGVGPALLAWIPKLAGIPVVITFHCIDRKHAKWGFIARAMLRLGEWCTMRFADQTITVAQTLYQYCLEAYDRETNYIPNGIAFPGHQKASAKILARFGLEPGRYILMVSRLVAHKSAHTLIAAYEKLPASQQKQFKLVIAGAGAFTDTYVKQLDQLTRRNHSVKLVGQQTGRRLDALFRGAALVVHPSTSEGLPIAVLEAMSYGKCVLASDIPENKEVIGTDFGVLFRTGSVDALVRKLTWILHEKLLSERIGAKAQRHVLRHYHWNAIATETSALYDGVLRERVPIPTTQLATAR